jgi:hypothetical protein
MEDAGCWKDTSLYESKGEKFSYKYIAVYYNEM